SSLVASASSDVVPNVARVRGEVQVSDSIVKMYTCSSAANPANINPAVIIVSPCRYSLFEQPRLTQAGDPGRRRQAQMGPGLRGGHAATWGAGHPSGAEQERVAHFLHGGRLLSVRHRQRRSADRAVTS